MQTYNEAVRPAPQDDEMAIDLRAVIRTLWRGKFVIVAAVIVAIAGAIYYLATRTPTYVATASVLIGRDAGQRLDIRASSDGPLNESVVGSQIRVIQSNRILGAVVDELELHRDPAFNPALRPDDGGINLNLTTLRYAVGDLVAPVFGEIPYLTRPTPEPRTPEEQAERQRTVAIAILSGRISASQSGSSYVINVSASDSSPRKAARLANAVVGAYIERQRAVKLEAATGVLTFLQSQIGTLRDQVDASAAAVNEFRIASGLTDESQIEQGAAQVEKLRSSLIDAQEVLNDLRIARDATDPSDTATLASLDGRIAALTSRAAALAASVTDAEADLAELVRQRTQFEELERRALAEQTLYEEFLNETNEIGALESYQQADARVIADALTPLSPSNPSSKLILALAIVLGGGLGVGLVALGELLQTTFRSRDELMAFTGRSVLGVLPKVRGSDDARRTLTALYARPTSDLAESARSLRAAILQRSPEPAVLLMTSAIAREGKTTTSILLASTAADIGKRVLLLDCDLRRSRLARLVDRKTATLDEVLSGERPLSEALTQPRDAPFDVIAARHLRRRSRGNALDLLSSPQMGKLVAALRRQYDLIILDTPPILPVTDAAVLSRHADGVLLVVRWRRTSRVAVANALGELRSFDARMIGLTLSGVDRRAEAWHRTLPTQAYYSG